VATAVASGVADYGVLPVWNAIIGAIPGVAEVLARTPLTVDREVVVPIVHCVLAPPGATLDGLRAVFSHPAAIGQCRQFFAARPGVTPAECYDTAGAARDVAARRRFDEGAIAGEHCAARYGLEVLAREVGDRPDNWTRFAVLSRPMMTTKDFRA
jgi:prephenate dehydratase